MDSCAQPNMQISAQVERERTLAALATLTTQGRAVGYCVIAALQDPRKEVLNTLRLCGLQAFGWSSAEFANCHCPRIRLG